MKFLRKMLIAIGFIIALAVIKIVLAKIFPVSQVFYLNMISSIQMMALSWAVITGLFETIWEKKYSKRKLDKLGFIIFIGLIAMGELIFMWSFHHPQFIPDSMLSSYRYYYNNYQRNILQYDRSMTTYDPTVFYKMRGDNRFLFSNVEFSDSFYVDKLGFRDNDSALQKKKVICLGDSYTLGWGVKQMESYPEQLQQQLKVPVLNTGMSSYGTARETESIRNLDMSGVENIVIQYCYNDADENAMFLSNENRLPISSKHIYDSACDELYWSNLYFPGKYFFTISKLFLRERINMFLESVNGKGKAVSVENLDKYKIMAVNFLAVLKNSGWDYRNKQIWVFDIGEYDRLNDYFINALKTELQKEENAHFFFNHIHCLKLTSFLVQSDYYLLDGHIKESGHRKIAMALSSLIKKEK